MLLEYKKQVAEMLDDTCSYFMIWGMRVILLGSEFWKIPVMIWNVYVSVQKTASP